MLDSLLHLALDFPCNQVTWASPLTRAALGFAPQSSVLQLPQMAVSSLYALITEFL
jgi:hypothetical protein